MGSRKNALHCAASIVGNTRESHSHVFAVGVYRTLTTTQ